MKNIIATGLVISSLALSTQASWARNVHDLITTQQNHGFANTLALGDFVTSCTPSGLALAEVRTIAVNGHNQITVHLRAQGDGAAASQTEGLSKTSTVTVSTPINFLVAKGNGNFLLVAVQYIPHGSTTLTTSSFITADSKIQENLNPTPTLLIDQGNGNYTIPLSHNGGSGIPQGAQLTALDFVQLGNQNNCDAKNSDINHVTINNRFIGIDTSAAAAFCGENCGGGSE